MEKLAIIFFAIILFSCSEKDRNSSKHLASEQKAAFDLKDSLFAFQNLTSTLFEKHLFRDQFQKIYSDSIRKIPLFELDTILKRKLIAPVFTSDMPMIDSEYATHNLNAYFVSKQKFIGNLLPIIVLVEGDDYTALFYILLNETFTPVSHFRLSGGVCGGPDIIGKIIKYCPVRQSFISEREIRSYSITEVIMPDSIPQLTIFDSVNYVSKILPTGQIKTKKLDSTRFEKMAD